MPKIVMIIAPKYFRDEELFETKKTLEAKGVEVLVASKTKNMAIGKLGGEVMPDLLISEINLDDFEGIVFVGGPGATIYLDDLETHQLAKEFNGQGKIVAAICIAPSILANAGMLQGIQATAFESEAENLKIKGAIYTGNPVEISGKIITANGPAASKKFGEEIAKTIGL